MLLAEKKKPEDTEVEQTVYRGANKNQPTQNSSTVNEDSI